MLSPYDTETLHHSCQPRAVNSACASEAARLETRGARRPGEEKLVLMPAGSCEESA